MRIRRRQHEMRLEMMPLLDVVFLLLTFFIFSMVLMVRVDLMDISLPALQSGRPSETTTAVTITIDRESQIAVNGDSVTVEEIPDTVRPLLAEYSDARLFVAIDQDSRAGEVLRVVDILRASDLRNFSVVSLPSETIDTINAGESPTG